MQQPPIHQPSDSTSNNQQSHLQPPAKQPPNRAHIIFVGSVTVFGLVVLYIASLSDKWTWVISAISLMVAIGQWLLPNFTVRSIPLQGMRNFFIQKRLVILITIIGIVTVFNFGVALGLYNPTKIVAELTHASQTPTSVPSSLPATPYQPATTLPTTRATPTLPDFPRWSSQTSGVSQSLWGVVWSGSQFVAVGGGGIIQTSPNGSTWTSQTSGAGPSLLGVTWSGSQFVAVGDTGAILTSSNESTWTSQPSHINNALKGVAWSGSQYVVVGDAGTILTSSNESTWTSQTSGTGQDLYSVSWTGSQFVAVGTGGTILTSP